MNIDTATLGATVTAIGALALAACALVDTSKTLPGGGVSSVGFTCIEAAVNLFFPKAPNQPKAPKCWRLQTSHFRHYVQSWLA